MATLAPDLAWTQARAGGRGVVAHAGEARTLGVSGSVDAGGRLSLGGADHVEEASSVLGGNASFIVRDGVDLDMGLDRSPGAPTGAPSSPVGGSTTVTRAPGGRRGGRAA